MCVCVCEMGAEEHVIADVIGLVERARNHRVVFANPGWSSNGSGLAVNLPLTVGCVLH